MKKVTTGFAAVIMAVGVFAGPAQAFELKACTQNDPCFSEPKPKGPADLAPAPKDDDKPKGPDELAPAPKDDDKPKGPQDKAPAPAPAPAPGPGSTGNGSGNGQGSNDPLGEGIPVATDVVPETEPTDQALAYDEQTEGVDSSETAKNENNLIMQIGAAIVALGGIALLVWKRRRSQLR